MTGQNFSISLKNFEKKFFAWNVLKHKVKPKNSRNSTFLKKLKFPPYFWKTLVKFSSPKCSLWYAVIFLSPREKLRDLVINFSISLKNFEKKNFFAWNVLKLKVKPKNSRNSTFFFKTKISPLFLKHLAVKKTSKIDRAFHRANLPRQGICLRRQGKSFTLFALLPCTNPNHHQQIDLLDSWV